MQEVHSEPQEEPKKADLKVVESSAPAEAAPAPKKVDKKPKMIRQTVYLPPVVRDQLRSLAFEEDRKMHSYLMEGLDKVFQDRGLKTIDELLNE
jgi:hypothetical protein